MQRSKLTTAKARSEFERSQNERENSAGLLEKLLKLDCRVAERFYARYREQFNPDLPVPDLVIEEWIDVGTFRAKEKLPPSRNRSLMGRLPKEPDADH